jgi:hypothetical protein
MLQKREEAPKYGSNEEEKKSAINKGRRRKKKKENVLILFCGTLYNKRQMRIKTSHEILFLNNLLHQTQ